MRDNPAAQEGAMSKAIKVGDIPHEIQRDVIATAVSAAVGALNLGNVEPKEAARQVAEAAVVAWRVVNGVSSPSPSLRATDGTLR